MALHFLIIIEQKLGRQNGGIGPRASIISGNLSLPLFSYVIETPWGMSCAVFMLEMGYN